jgi:hypothetical protein
MIARLYTGFPEPYKRTRQPVVIGGEYSGPAVEALRKTLCAEYKVRIADNDLDGYRW